MLNIHLVPCLKDNYAYLVHEPQSGAVAIVDPSEAKPVLAALTAHGLKLTHIFNTHHHWDHTGGNLELKQQTGARITGPKHDADRIPGIDVGVAEGDTIELGRAHAKILDIPAHTKAHIAFWFGADNAVFTGDTMFAMGCGRLFEGTPAQMWTSLNKLAALQGELDIPMLLITHDEDDVASLADEVLTIAEGRVVSGASAQPAALALADAATALSNSL